ncbi:trans-sulfuration enzyme family protein [Mesorhizobium delmotii]|uniref:Putative cystathionine beta-lyase n=1 Tax=Mesorhizobium delmotii TaxID=1631247 RepID=A0A2P9ARP5_9HYPH|nr:PLP-dependent transferase [Mesorhizobium delmotii]SJM33757.1 putative cystathionine beta-lyase [Mesorhizobium delmotii]
MQNETLHVHPPSADDSEFGGLSLPIHRASTVVFETAEAFESRHERIYDGYSYGLYGTPTSRALERQIAALEGATRALLTPSGLSAIALVCLAVAKTGDRILMPFSMYGPARLLASRLLQALGIETVGYDPMIGTGIAELLDVRTSLVWLESPGSVTFEVQDLPAVVAAARGVGAVVAADNTWATPILFNPLVHGADISMQSLSKYASGHSDLLMGSLAVRDETLFRKLKDTARLLGLGVNPDDCFLCARGLKTLPLRLRQSERSAIQILEAIRSHDAIAKVLHPSLQSHPGHEIWKRDFDGSNGVFSLVFAPASKGALQQAFGSLRYFKIGASWGGATSLMAPSDPRDSRPDLDWLPDGQVVRLSIGLENVIDLIEDLTGFLSVIAGAKQARPGRIAGTELETTWQSRGD